MLGTIRMIFWSSTIMSHCNRSNILTAGPSATIVEL